MRVVRRPWWSLPLLLLLLTAPLSSLATPLPGDGTMVETADGPLRGEAGDGYRAFRGIAPVDFATAHNREFWATYGFAE
ncbi:MAG: hypothetical protein M3464_13965 [Chloroflexota bacterium]|nr:hypothetical protein [Chloroflexota bacterium]